MFEGDFPKLKKLTRELAGVSKLQPPITEAAKDEVWSQWGKDFASQQDPYGKHWAPTKTGKAPVLYSTGALASATISTSPLKVKLNPEPYWAFHQAGAHGMAEREVLPFRAGSTWDKPIQSVIEQIIEDHFKTTD